MSKLQKKFEMKMTNAERDELFINTNKVAADYNKRKKDDATITEENSNSCIGEDIDKIHHTVTEKKEIEIDYKTA